MGERQGETKRERLKEREREREREREIERERETERQREIERESNEINNWSYKRRMAECTDETVRIRQFVTLFSKQTLAFVYFAVCFFSLHVGLVATKLLKAKVFDCRDPVGDRQNELLSRLSFENVGKKTKQVLETTSLKEKTGEPP